MNPNKYIKLICSVSVMFLLLSNSVFAASQCSGLSSSACSSKSSQCTWRKSSVNKNGTKTKAHCRALPGKAKTVSKSKAKASSTQSSAAKKKASATKTKATKSKKAAVKKKTTKTKKPKG